MPDGKHGYTLWLPLQLYEENARDDEIIDSGTWQLRHPVGPDAVPFLKWRESMSDQDWVAVNAADDDAWYRRMERDCGMAIRPPLRAGA